MKGAEQNRTEISHQKKQLLDFETVVVDELAGTGVPTARPDEVRRSLAAPQEMERGMDL